MWWIIICIVLVGISCFFIGFCIRRSNNNRQNVRDEVLINDSNNRQNESDVLDENRNNIVRENTDDHEVILVNNYINKDLSISRNCSYQINSKVLKKKSNSFGKSSMQNLAISQTNLIINNNIVFNRIDNKDDIDKGMSVFRQPGIFRQRLEEREKIKKQQIEQMKQRLLRSDRKIKSKIKDMPAPKPMDEDVKEDDEI